MKTVKSVITFIAVLLAANAHSQTLNVKAFIEGFYNESNSTMKAVIDPVSYPSLFDTIEVTLASSVDGSILFSENAVFDINGSTTLSIPSNLLGQNVYVALKHRSSIETWSAYPLMITSTATVDFTTATSEAYGANMIWKTNAACIYSGDVYDSNNFSIGQDGFIDIFDYMLLDGDIQSGTTGYYLTADLNGDSAVDTLDYLIIQPNVQNGIFAIVPFVTSVGEYESFNDKISVWPNPANDFINVKLMTENVNTFNIYNTSGALVDAGSLNNVQYRIDVSNLASGLYIMKVDKDVLKFTVKH